MSKERFSKTTAPEKSFSTALGESHGDALLEIYTKTLIKKESEQAVSAQSIDNLIDNSTNDLQSEDRTEIKTPQDYCRYKAEIQKRLQELKLCLDKIALDISILQRKIDDEAVALNKHIEFKDELQKPFLQITEALQSIFSKHISIESFEHGKFQESKENSRMLAERLIIKIDKDFSKMEQVLQKSSAEQKKIISLEEEQKKHVEERTKRKDEVDTLEIKLVELEEVKSTFFPITSDEKAWIQKRLLSGRKFSAQDVAEINKIFWDSAEFRIIEDLEGIVVPAEKVRARLLDIYTEVQIQSLVEAVSCLIAKTRASSTPKNQCNIVDLEDIITAFEIAGIITDEQHKTELRRFIKKYFEDKKHCNHIRLIWRRDFATKKLCVEIEVCAQGKELQGLVKAYLNKEQRQEISDFALGIGKIHCSTDEELEEKILEETQKRVQEKLKNIESKEVIFN